MRWVIGAGILLAAYTFVVIYGIKHSTMGRFTQGILITASAFSSVYVFYRQMTRAHQQKAIELGLTCSGCQKCLVKPNLTTGSADPDWRADGNPPDRCPHCQLGIYRAWDRSALL